MIGITMDELRERLSWGHDIEFTYHNEEYVIQQEEGEGEEVNMVIWKLTPKAYCICKYLIPSNGQIPDECINAILNDKCIDGKSFMEIERDITVDAIL